MCNVTRYLIALYDFTVFHSGPHSQSHSHSHTAIGHESVQVFFRTTDQIQVYAIVTIPSILPLRKANETGATAEKKNLIFMFFVCCLFFELSSLRVLKKFFYLLHTRCCCATVYCCCCSVECSSGSTQVG